MEEFSYHAKRKQIDEREKAPPNAELLEDWQVENRVSTPVLTAGSTTSGNGNEITPSGFSRRLRGLKKGASQLTRRLTGRKKNKQTSKPEVSLALSR